MLGEGLPDAFGELLDYSRALRFDEKPDYARFLALFDDLYPSPIEYEKSLKSNTASGGTPHSPLTSAKPEKNPPCPVELGQLVYVQLLPRMTIEGYTARANDPSYYDNPSLSGEEWQMSMLPAVVLGVTQVDDGARHIIKVVPLVRGPPSIDAAQDSVSLPIQDMLIPTDAFSSLEDVYCYSFPRVNTFVCDPDQDAIPTYWKIASDATQSLLERLDPFPPDIEDAEISVDRDIRTDGRMRKHLDYRIYVKLCPLQPITLRQSLEGTAADWRSQRGWFDDLVKISKRRSVDVGWRWTATDGEGQEEDDEFSDSYFAFDLEYWDNRQQERDRSLTLGPRQDDELLDQQIQMIVKVE